MEKFKTLSSLNPFLKGSESFKTYHDPNLFLKGTYSFSKRIGNPQYFLNFYSVQACLFGGAVIDSPLLVFGLKTWIEFDNKDLV